MPSPSEVIENGAPRVSTVAKALAKQQNIAGRGRGTAHCVRLSDAVADLFEQAKGEKQSMPEFLREAGLTIALQRLEESQA